MSPSKSLNNLLSASLATVSAVDAVSGRRMLYAQVTAIAFR